MLDDPSPTAAFRDDALKGLGRAPRALSPKYLYDARGSDLFEKITALPEYYPTRTELAVLEASAARIADAVGPQATVLEFGSGASVKVRLLLDALAAPAGYIAVDISQAALHAAVGRLRAEYGDLTICGVHADYTRPFALPPGVRAAGGPVLGFFPGSTIGNFSDGEARDFLRAARDEVGAGGWLLLGADLVKERAILEAAYDDAAGITAAFNMNLLARMNRELEADFDLDSFRHRAFFNEAESRIEMHLESLAAQTARVAGADFTFVAGETIHTENSRKFRIPEVEALARDTGFAPVETFTDSREWFGVFLLRAA